MVFLVFLLRFLKVSSQGNSGQVFLGISDLAIIHNPFAPPCNVHTPICANHEKHYVTEFRMVFMSSLSFMSCLSVFFPLSFSHKVCEKKHGR
jgi:hypothetical protein